MLTKISIRHSLNANRVQIRSSRCSNFFPLQRRRLQSFEQTLQSLIYFLRHALLNHAFSTPSLNMAASRGVDDLVTLNNQDDDYYSILGCDKASNVSRWVLFRLSGRVVLVLF